MACGCDAPGFQPESITLMIRSTELTLVKRRSTWAITSKTSPMTPCGQPWSNPAQKSLEHPFASRVSRYFCHVLQISPKDFKFSQYKSCVFCRGIQLSC
jgi:hypothetical protein